MNPRLNLLLTKNQLLDSKGQLECSNPARVIEVLNKEFDQQDFAIDAISKELEKLKIVLDTTPCTVSWVNSDLTYGGVNKTLADICKLPADDFPGKTIGYYSNDKYFYKFSQSLFHSDKQTVYEELIGHIDGQEKRFWVVGTKFDNNQQGVIIGIDITEIRNLEHMVAFMDKLSSLGEMVASIVHEVNNPLTAIKMNAQMIPKFISKNDLDKAIDYSKKIDATSDRIAKIIRGVKTFVRRGDEDGRETIAITSLLMDAFTICEGKFKQKNVQFYLPDVGGDLSLNCNITQVFQVFVNLMTNAIDAVENLPEKWVRVKVESQGQHIRVLFVDSGPGIPENVRKNLFKSFYTTKAVGQGTGLGLALCKKIMEEHGGGIEVLADEPNTTFALNF